MDKSADRGGILCTARDDRYRRNETIAHEKNGTSSHRLGATPNIFANFAGKWHLLLDSTENGICYWTVHFPPLQEPYRSDVGLVPHLDAKSFAKIMRII